MRVQLLLTTLTALFLADFSPAMAFLSPPPRAPALTNSQLPVSSPLMKPVERRRAFSHLRISADGKETTLDRIFGPKLFKTVTSTAGIHSFPLVVLRVCAGLLMIHHGSEGGILPANTGSEQFQGFTTYVIETYFKFLPGPGGFWSALHDYAEFVGGVLFACGFFTRPAAFTLFTTMISAVYFHISATGWQGAPFGHVPNYSYDFEEPLLYAGVFLLYFFNGCGGFGVDEIIYGAIKDEKDQVQVDLDDV